MKQNRRIFGKHIASGASSEGWMLFGVATAIGLFTFVVYLKAITFGFLDWDDNHYVTHNPLLLKEGWDFVCEALVSFYPGNWHPLTTMSYKLDSMFWGYDPMGYHLTNIILHAVATVTVFLFGYRLFSFVFQGRDNEFLRLLAAAFCAVLFGIHPLHVESVAWVSERKDQLSTIFFVLSLLFYLKHRSGAEPGRIRFYVLSLVCCVLSLMSKAMAVTIPVVLLILDFYPLGRINGLRELAIETAKKAPFIVLSFVVSVLTILAQKVAIAPLDVKPVSVRVAHMFQTYVFYLEKTVFPKILIPFYPHSTGISLLSAETILSAAFLAGVTAVCLIFLKKRPYIAAAWAYYLVTLVPVIGILQVGGQVAADRYMYIPSISLFLLFGAAVVKCYGYKGIRAAKFAAAAVGALIVVLLTVKTLSQIDIWKDDYTFWTHELAYASEGSTDVAVIGHIKRGQYLFNAGRLDEAIADFDAGIKANPAAWNHYVMRGNAFLNRNKGDDMEKAKIDFKAALLLDGSKAIAYRNLALAYTLTGNHRDAGKYKYLADRIEKGEKLSSKEIADAAAPLKLRTAGEGQDM